MACKLYERSRSPPITFPCGWFLRRQISSPDIYSVTNDCTYLCVWVWGRDGQMAAQFAVWKDAWRCWQRAAGPLPASIIPPPFSSLSGLLEISSNPAVFSCWAPHPPPNPPNTLSFPFILLSFASKRFFLAPPAFLHPLLPPFNSSHTTGSCCQS